VTTRQSIPISRIRLDGGTQPRTALDFEAIEDYSEAMAAGAKFPPVTVSYDGMNYWLADGFHRVKAVYATEHDTIECEIRQGTLEDAQWYSFSANRTNGLRRSNDDKQRALRAALEHPNGAQLSNRQIAAHVGVAEATVRNWREKLTAQIAQSAERIGRDGRTINVTNIGRATAALEPEPGHQTGAAPPSATTDDLDASHPASSAPVRATRAQRIDRLARLTLSFIEATKHLAHLVCWLGETAGEFDEAELLLSKVGDSADAIIAEIERKAVVADPLNASRLGIQEK
jgi:transposase-like protein